MNVKSVEHIWTRFEYSIKSLPRDIYNKLNYGIDAPQYCERIWVNPLTCSQCITGLGGKYSGKIINTTWPPPSARIMNILEQPKILACYKHWVQGVPWEETGIFQFLFEKIQNHPKKCFDDCYDLETIKMRYAKLDIIFEEVKNELRIKTCTEIDPWFFREKDGIYFHIGPDGSLFFGDGGCHRFAMALVLGLNNIPAKLGCIHKSSLHLLPLRRKPPQDSEKCRNN